MTSCCLSVGLRRPAVAKQTLKERPSLICCNFGLHYTAFAVVITIDMNASEDHMMAWSGESGSLS